MKKMSVSYGLTGGMFFPIEWDMDSMNTQEWAYMRHPADIPIQYSVLSRPSPEYAMRDISPGGLCFRSDEDIPVGSRIRLAVELGEVSGQIEGIVAWTLRRDYFYDIGVKFARTADKFHFRLIEQLCAIAHYRNAVREKDGRELSNEEAAREWIDQFAGDFPE